jgi:hypothetical protein
VSSSLLLPVSPPCTHIFTTIHILSRYVAFFALHPPSPSHRVLRGTWDRAPRLYTLVLPLAVFCPASLRVPSTSSTYRENISVGKERVREYSHRMPTPLPVNHVFNDWQAPRSLGRSYAAYITPHYTLHTHTHSESLSPLIHIHNDKHDDRHPGFSRDPVLSHRCDEEEDRHHQGHL